VGPVEAARRRQLELAADASHELRTPLTVIEAELALARDGPGDEDEWRATLDHIGRESARLRRIVEDLLWLARFDSAPPPPPGPSDLGAVVTTCAERFDAVARARGLTLTVDDATPTDATLAVDVNGEWLDKLTGTLLDNACRYSPAGGAVEVTVRGRAGRAVLTVADSGPGIPEAERDHLFDRFRRASTTPGGAGLGLAIADSVVRSSGGRWRVGDAALGGAAMEVSWRVNAAAARTKRAPSAAASTAPSADGGVADAGLPYARRP
jgi:signal transduction histidine kinase